MKAKVVEVFTSIQGEGPYMGYPATFVRFSGCNLRCPRCDTKYAWDGGIELSIEELANEIAQHGVLNIVYTGGEPLLQSEVLVELSNHPHLALRTKMIETNATIIPENIEELAKSIRVWVLSPKLPSLNPNYNMNDFVVFFKNIIKHSVEVYVKFVVGKREELDIVQNVCKDLRWCLSDVILQPLDGGDITYKELVEEVVRRGMSNFRVLPQLHKLVGMR